MIAIAIDLYDTGSKCTIENGTFIGNIHAVYVFEGTLVVYGGTFSVQQKYSEEYPDEYVLNCYDEKLSQWQCNHYRQWWFLCEI